MSNSIWVVDTPSVVSEVIDDELVVMNLATGHYFSSTGSGAVAWACLEQGMDNAGIAAALGQAFDAPAAQIDADLAAFIESLRSNGLVRAGDAASPATAATGHRPPAAPAQRLPYSSPQMNAYTDMKDLLMLDPIHDVADEGWPMRPAERAA
jgi:Coenzyme PQQ synthesis protein D (PqqD)